jgi:hypothetical protein
VAVNEDARELGRVMLDAGRPFEWTLIVLSAYFTRDVALAALEQIAEHEPAE